jgi:type IV pilus assembly protein PilV
MIANTFAQGPELMNRFHSQRGFNLVEAMVTLVVVSVGMIGIAALYGQGLGAGRTALYRTVAVNLTADMADRIRLNRTALGNYNGPPQNNACDAGGAVNCTTAQMAQHDLWAWNQLVTQSLPNGAGVVRYAAGAPPTYTIGVTWEETGIGAVNYTVALQVPTL